MSINMPLNKRCIYISRVYKSRGGLVVFQTGEDLLMLNKTVGKNNISFSELCPPN